MRYAKLALVVAVIALVTLLSAPPAQAGVSFSFFYNHLSPHGSWQVSAEFGRVWQPSVYSSGWNPYYDGHWVYSDLGWAWASDYAWGDIPYHYGTWVLDPYYGWVWVPGYTWAPSWVVFRTGPDYIGWAPVSPGFSVGVSFGSYAPAPASFVFVSAHNFLAPRIRSCYVPPSRTTVIVNNTRVVNNLMVENNVVVNRGPDRRFVEQASGRSVRAVPIERVSRAMPGPRASRSELRVDPQQARRGLHAAEPVSAERSLPDRSAGMDAPRAGRRLTADKIERQRDIPAARGSMSADAPRVSRRETSDIERQHDISADTPRANRRLSTDIGRQGGPAARGTNRPEATDRRLATDFERQRGPGTRGNEPRVSERGMKQQEFSQRVYREQPSPRVYREQPSPRVYGEQPGVWNRGGRLAGPEIMRPGRVSPRDNGSMRQPSEPNRRPDSGRQAVSSQEEPSRGRPSGKAPGRKSHGSGKD